MAINEFRIESFLDNEELHYFRATTDEGGAWFLMFGQKTGVHIRLLEDGECLLVRSLPLVHLDEYDEAGQTRVLRAMAQRNDQIMVGRYSGTETVIVEAALPIEDGEVSDNQIRRLLGVIVNESNYFGPQLRSTASDKDFVVECDPIDDLMRKLIEGGEPSDGE
ncbi:MAG: YbjN domain-containing protein [Planctomycetota bacterium]